MPALMRKLFYPLRDRLSRRIVFWIFLSVIVIEAIILIPSYKKQERDLLARLIELATAQIEVIVHQVPNDAPENRVFRRLEKLQNFRHILGGAVYHKSGRPLGTFGERPALMFVDIDNIDGRGRFDQDKSRYDAVWTADQLKRDWVLILRQNATSVHRELKAYILRITGLIVIISIFVTVGAWIALHPLVVLPVLRLREDLIKAGKSISEDRRSPRFFASTFKRSDELGDVVAAFRLMYQQILDAIRKRKTAEVALQKSLRQVEAYSNALNQELERGRQMQANFLPATLITEPGWELAAYFKPAGQVAGDFYDTFKLPEHRIGLVIADVCDKGVGAALFMALFRSLIRIFSGQTTLNGLACPVANPPIGHPDANRRGNPPSPVLPLQAIELTNDYIAQNHGDLAMFATIFFGTLDLKTGTLSYINGGHEPPLIIQPSGGIREALKPSGPAVGIQPGTQFDVRQTTIAPGELLLSYTDGITEARNTEDDFFNQKRLLTVLETAAGSAEDLLTTIASAIDRHVGHTEQFDDMTMLAIRRTPP